MADYEALKTLLASLVRKDNLAKFNCFGNSNGRINIHIQLLGSHENISDLPPMSLRRKSDKQLKRNHQRANTWRDSLTSETPQLQTDLSSANSDTDNMDRNISKSEPGLNVLNTSAVESHSNLSKESQPSESMDHSQSKQIQRFDKPPMIPPPDPSIPPNSNQNSETLPKHSILRQTFEDVFYKNRNLAAAPTKPTTFQKSHKTEGTDQCTESWCAIGRISTCCKCTKANYPCEYCKETHILKKLCERCKKRQF